VAPLDAAFAAVVGWAGAVVGDVAVEPPGAQAARKETPAAPKRASTSRRVKIRPKGRSSLSIKVSSIL
jgi:hypothetical protein